MAVTAQFIKTLTLNAEHTALATNTKFVQKFHFSFKKKLFIESTATKSKTNFKSRWTIVLKVLVSNIAHL